jgi:hypothetical protein
MRTSVHVTTEADVPRGPAPAWTKKAEHTEAAAPYIDAAFRMGYDTELTWGGIATRDRADMMRRGLFNAARCHDPQVSVHASVEPSSNGEWQIRFAVHDKRKARAFIVAKHGKDRAAWPYNARARGA